MKRFVLYISAVCLIIGWGATNIAAQSVTIPYNANLLILPSNDTKNPIIAISSTSSFEQLFPGLNKVNNLGISSARIESIDPSKKNLGMLFKSIKVYLSTGDGSNEILLVSRGIAANAGSSLILPIAPNLQNSEKRGLNPNYNYTSVDQAILAKSSSVQASPNGGITVRGINGMQQGPPLYVVDGVERSNAQGLNPNDISSIEVLKNAGDLAMYGMRGANGVIIIKTKGGDSDTEESSGSLDKFTKGSTIWVRFEYVLRNAITAETSLKLNVNFKSPSFKK